MRIVSPSAELLWITPEARRVIESAGRVCYKSESRATDQSADAFIRRLVAAGHESVLEHGVAAFRLVCDRGVSHEIVRHRIASYSQESTRYCNYTAERFGREIAVVRPPDLEGPALAAWEAGASAAEKAYFDMLDAGQSPQIARSVLPTCLKTEMIMTANFREWRHFLALRLAPAAHPQIREIASLAAAALRAAAPSVFLDLPPADPQS